MPFKLIPILDKMKEFYSKPISNERFQNYIKMLQGGSNGALVLPISGYNPMAKDHLISKIDELQQLNAEGIGTEIITDFNENFNVKEEISVVLNIGDDLFGGWTNKYSTDFDSKFKINALITRGFCAPHFWSSEEYTKESIRKAISEYLFRSVYWLQNPKPITLEDYFNQELFVFKKANSTSQYSLTEAQKTIDFYEKNKLSTDYTLIFNFFYGDDASASLNYTLFGIQLINGFELAKILALKK